MDKVEFNEDGVQQTSPSQPESGKPIGWAILCFLLPLVGLILFIVWRKEQPRKAKWSGIAAIAGVIVAIILNIAVGGAIINKLFNSTDIASKTSAQIEKTAGSEINTDGEYKDFVTDIFIEMSESLTEFASLNSKASSDEDLLADEEWLTSIGTEAGNLQAYCNMIIEYKDVPSDYKEAHTILVKAAKLYKEAMTTYIDGVDTADTSKIIDSTKLMNDASREIREASSLFRGNSNPT